MNTEVWLDAQLSPLLVKWITETLGLDCRHVRDLGLRNSSDKEIFFAARKTGTIIITKDSDFQELVQKFNSPPKIIWLTCGNTSNEYLKTIFLKRLPEAIAILNTDSDLVEITD
jgi:predicted nuclease of predicted toxin-antitoxin system